MQRTFPNEPFIINIYLDKEFQYTHVFNRKSTLEDVKLNILHTLQIYSINYIITYNDQEYTKFDKWPLKEIFLLPKEQYNLYLTKLKTIKEEQSQKVLMTYFPGDKEIIIYKMISMKFSKAIPQINKLVSFADRAVIPFNSRSVNILHEKKLVITGGLEHKYTACYYDFDINYIVDLPKMKHPRERHSMVNIESKVFIIGGDCCKKVTCLNLEYQDYEDYPDMKLDRKDPAVCIVNKQYLYVFMGYSNDYGDVANNFEKLDISKSAYCDYWKLLPLNNMMGLKMPKVYSAVLPTEKGFLFFGGSCKSTVDEWVLLLEETRFEFSKSGLKLPFKTSFIEKSFLQQFEGSDDYYLFTFGNQLIRFNITTRVIDEIKPDDYGNDDDNDQYYE